MITIAIMNLSVARSVTQTRFDVKRWSWEFPLIREFSANQERGRGGLATIDNKTAAESSFPTVFSTLGRSTKLPGNLTRFVDYPRSRVALVVSSGTQLAHGVRELCLNPSSVRRILLFLRALYFCRFVRFSAVHPIGNWSRL